MTILVASNGRAGSTLLFQSIVLTLAKQSILPGLLRNYPIFWGFDEAPKSRWTIKQVKKTHCLPSEIDPNLFRKVIFVYGDPLESALSVYYRTLRDGMDWFRLHQKNLRGFGDFDNLFQFDILNYENQIISWADYVSANKDKVMLIKFDDLWNRERELESFLGFSLNLPPRKERLKKSIPRDVRFSEKLFDHLFMVYNDLVE